MIERALQSPRVAWPTLFVFIGAVSSWTAGVVLGATGTVSVAPAVLMAALGAYAAFTAVHEAAHRSIARARWVSEIIGRIAGIPLMGAFTAARYVHLQHHKHTNEPDADPDHYSGRGPRWALPLRWLTQDLHYYVLYVKSWRSRPRAERREVLATFAAFAGAASLLVALGHAREVVLFWLLPARLALGFLAFAFDWLPHRPHAIPSRTDRFRATRAHEGALLHLLLFGQSLHLVHHLYPAVPFYRYRRVWREKVRAMVAAHVALTSSTAEDSPATVPPP